jgi:hypothetical protein
MHLMNIKKAKYSLSGVELCDEPLIGSSLSTYYHWLTCINTSQDSYLLATDRSQLVVISVDVQLQASVDHNTKSSFLDSRNKTQTISCAPF